VDEIDEVCDGDTLVASQGEEFEPLALDDISLGRSPTASTAVSGISSGISSACTIATPSPASRVASATSAASFNSSAVGAVSRAVSGVSDASSMTRVSSAPAELASLSEAPPLHTHLTVLQAAPLISLGERGEMRPMPMLDLEAERREITDMLASAGREIAVSFEPATTDALRRVATMGVRVLHYSGHGEEDFLAFEDGSGGTHKLTPALLAATTCAGSTADESVAPSSPNPTGVQLVFVCACHSQPAALAFVRAGVPHVVAVRASALLLDKAAALHSIA
jgi:hypothetical protein